MADIYEMKLHEVIHEIPESGNHIQRVPGGWIYTRHRLDRGQMTSVFVPFNNEFMESTPHEPEPWDETNNPTEAA